MTSRIEYLLATTGLKGLLEAGGFRRWALVKRASLQGDGRWRFLLFQVLLCLCFFVMPFLAPRAEELGRAVVSHAPEASLLARTTSLLCCAAALLAMAASCRSRRMFMAPLRA